MGISMKIVQINTVVGTGSVGRIAAHLYEMSIANGIQASVGYGRGQAPEGMQAIKIGSKPDMYCHVARNFFLGESGFGSAHKTRAFLAKLDEIQPDLLHLHNIHGFYLQIEMLFSYIKSKKIPVVWTLHDCWPMTGHCAYFDYAKCEKWKTGCHQCEQQRSAYPYALFKDNSIQNYKRKKAAFTGVENLTVVTPSKWLCSKVKESFLQEYPVVIIPNGINTELFRPRTEEALLQKGYKTTRAHTHTIEILGVANIWESRKGLDYFKVLAERLPENYHITLVGLSAQQIRSFYTNADMKQKVTAVTRTESQEELAKLYAKADVYVNTTLEDNFPTTNLEALACGTPVITFATGGSPEAIEGDGCIGRVVPQGDAVVLSQAIQQMTEQIKPVESCVKRAGQYEAKICFQQYIDLYRSILETTANGNK